jgi:hypothetical protein
VGVGTGDREDAAIVWDATSGNLRHRLVEQVFFGHATQVYRPERA